MMRLRLFLIMLLVSSSVLANDKFPVELRITEPYLELHTGPASEYRIEHVLMQQDTILLKKQYADWFFLQQDEKVSGWAPLKVLLDNRVDSVDMSFDEFLINYEGDLEFDLSFRSGFIDGDFFLAVEAGHQLSDELRVAVNISQVPGKISESNITSIDLEYIVYKFKSIKPFVTLGVGMLSNKPSAQVIGGEELETTVTRYGLGMVFAESKRIKFLAGLYSYAPEDDAFKNDFQEISIGLKYAY